MRESSLGVERLGRLFGGLVCALKEMVINYRCGVSVIEVLGGRVCFAKGYRERTRRG
jgi:hypothetical protein